MDNGKNTMVDLVHRTEAEKIEGHTEGVNYGIIETTAISLFS